MFNISKLPILIIVLIPLVKLMVLTYNLRKKLPLNENRGSAPMTEDSSMSSKRENLPKGKKFETKGKKYKL